MALAASNNLIMFWHGFFYALELGHGEAFAAYYRDFLDQARSSRGLDGDVEQEDENDDTTRVL